MLYKILQYIIQKSLELHFGEIKNFNLNAVPQKGPLVIAASHPNSFLDAIIIAISIKRPLHFLARSDVFSNPIANKILRRLNLIPIYRIKEGRSNLGRNEETFQECFEILKNDGAILIFAEGISVSDKLLRPLKKGLARIVFGFHEKYPKAEIPKIIACGINYDNPNKFRGKVLLGYGNTIQWNDLTENSKPNIKKYSLLNERIAESLKEHSIIVQPEDEALHQALVELDTGYEQTSMVRMALIANRIHNLKRENPEMYEKLRTEVSKLGGILTPYKLGFYCLKHRVEVEPIDFILAIVLAPFAMLGYLFNALPFILAKFIAKKSTLKDPEFYLSVRFSVGSLFWLFWALLVTALTYSLIGPVSILSPLFLFGLMKLYQNNKRRRKLIQRLNRIKKMKSNRKDAALIQDEIRKILELRTSLSLSSKA